jgi:uncharacterized protein YoxC
MSGAEIAGIIISAAVALLVLLLGLPLVKLARLIDESARSVQIFNNELEPILSEAKVTLVEANKQLQRVDKITSDVEQVTTNINSLVAVVTSAVGGPATKLAGVVQGLMKVFGSRR